MGASAWHYFAPYQPDLNQALQELRERVFAAGTYRLIDPWWRGISFEEFVENPDQTVDDLDENELRDYRDEYDRLQALAPPTTIEELLDWNGEEGTGTILDMHRVADEPDFSVVTPLPKKLLLESLGTWMPTRAHIEWAGIGALLALARRHGYGDREHGVAVILYDDEEPAEILFFGTSGD